MPYDLFSNNGYEASTVLTGLNYQAAYVFETRAVDKLMATEPSSSGTIRCLPLFHWGEEDFVFEIPVIFNAGAIEIGDKTFTGNLRLKGSGNYGNKLNFGDKEYCYISEPTDDSMEIYAYNGLDLVSPNGVTVNGSAIPQLEQGAWTPQLSDEDSSYITRYGWYMKIGQVVTIGFYIKASCPSGLHGAPITIVGLPYTPAYAAAGGGMCSGAYISGGMNFQCFVAETYGEITTRVQACNNTSAANLSTSASGCCYRNGGGEITLSGTITFVTSVG